MLQKFLWSLFSFFYKLIFIISFLPVTIWLKKNRHFHRACKSGVRAICWDATQSQDGWGWNEPWEVILSSPLLKKSPQEPAAQEQHFPYPDRVGCLPWWRFYNLCFSLCPLPLGSTEKSLALLSLHPPFRYSPWWHSLWASSSLGKTVPTLRHTLVSHLLKEKR